MTAIGTVKRSYQIAAFLRGVADLLGPLFPDACGVRPFGDGSPRGAYQGGGWFCGVWWGGMRQGPANGGAQYVHSVGVDLTRVIGSVPTKKQGEFWLSEGELFERAAYVGELLSRDDSTVANACNAALSTMTGGEPDGLFRERFADLRISAVQTAGNDWVVAKASEGKAPTVFYARLTLSGVLFLKLRSELPS